MTGGTRRTRRGALGLIIGATASYGMAPTELFAQSASPALLDASLIDTEGSAEHTLNDVAVRQGFFEQAGIRSDVAYILGTDGLIGALTRGTADLCLASGISPVIAAIADGAPLRIVAGANLLNVHTVFSKFENIRTLRDLEGKRVGVSRGYTVTTGVWARAILNTQYGVDLSKVTWVLSGDEHVAEYRPPANVVPIEAGKKMEDMLISGELVAAIGLEVEHEDVGPLIPNALDVGLAALKSSGHYPINHLVVIKNELIAKYPDLPADVFNAFAESKRLYVADLKAGKVQNPTAFDKMHLRVAEIMPDPLPYGIEPNRKVIEELMGNAYAQGIITRKTSAEDIFAPSTHKLVG